MRSSSRYTFLAISLFLISCNAQAELEKFKLCEEKFPGSTQTEKENRHQCFVALDVPTTPKYHLDRLWPTHNDVSGIVAYKQNYLLLNQNDLPNREPTSPNPKNQVTPNYRYEPQEAKFQFSLKSQYPHPTWLNDSDSLWFAYTQQSHWQIANGANSRPFRESNYEPEPIIYSRKFDKPAAEGSFSLRFINVGFVHQSNGQALPYSRSWNRLYLQAGAEKILNSGSSIAVALRPWYRFTENPDKDDNPDITNYLGNFDLEFFYWRGKYLVTALIRNQSLQMDWSMPMPMGEF